MELSRYGMSIDTKLSMGDAEEAIREALAGQGFGVLTEIDVAATLKKKLDLDRPPYRILGACNPGIAARALEADPDIGLLLPCNVVVADMDGTTRVSIIDPNTMIGLSGDDALAPLAAEARGLLEKALAALEE